MENVNHGLIVEKVVRRSGISISQLARILNVNRRSVYNWFNQYKLSADTIFRISNALAYDFSKEIPEYSNYKLRKRLHDEENFQTERWKAKYLELLEKYNDLLVARHRSLEDVA